MDPPDTTVATPPAAYPSFAPADLQLRLEQVRLEIREVESSPAMRVANRRRLAGILSLGGGALLIGLTGMGSYAFVHCSESPCESRRRETLSFVIPMLSVALTAVVVGSFLHVRGRRMRRELVGALQMEYRAIRRALAGR